MTTTIAYLLGLLTLPILAGVYVGFTFLIVLLDDRLGVSFEGKRKRRVDEVSDYVLHHDIWWERTFGPIFVGGWYRENYREGREVPLIGRWVGLGRPAGPCFMVIRTRTLPKRKAD